MARIIEFKPAPKADPDERKRDCGDCAHFYSAEVFPRECRECKWFPYLSGRVKDNFVYTAVTLSRRW